MLKFFSDFANALRQESLERIKSPILGSFVFSWLAWNWKMLTLLTMSKKDIEYVLAYIDLNFHYSRLLILPLVTTAIICYFLPRANQFVAKLQKEPNSMTAQIQLNEKIDISELQQKLAEIEARKELAKLKVEKEIDKNIEATLEANNTLQDKNTLLEIEIEQNKESIIELTVSRDTLANIRDTDKEIIEKLKGELEYVKDENKNATEAAKESQDKINALDKEMQSLASYNTLNVQKIETLLEKEKNHHQDFLILTECFPNMFKMDSTDGKLQLMHEAVAKMTKLNDDNWSYKLQQSSYQHFSRIKLPELKEYVDKIRASENQS